MGINVSYIDNGDNGTITLTSGSFGSTSKAETVASVSNSAYNALGLTNGQTFAGVDVAGTINGEAASGTGQILTGNAGNKTTAGLKIQVKLNDSELTDTPEAKLTISKGIAATLNEFANSLTKATDGTVARRTKGLQSQVDLIKSQVDDANAQMEIKRQMLETKFLQMEQTLQQLNSQSAYLTAQLNAMQGIFSSSLGTGSSSSSSSGSGSSGTGSTG
jgi:flagellar hook-associated protein 2